MNCHDGKKDRIRRGNVDPCQIRSSVGHVTLLFCAFFPRFKHVYYTGHFPKPHTDVRGRRGRYAKRLMNEREQSYNISRITQPNARDFRPSWRSHKSPRPPISFIRTNFLKGARGRHAVASVNGKNSGRFRNWFCASENLTSLKDGLAGDP